MDLGDSELGVARHSKVESHCLLVADGGVKLPDSPKGKVLSIRTSSPLIGPLRVWAGDGLVQTLMPRPDRRLCKSFALPIICAAIRAEFLGLNLERVFCVGDSLRSPTRQRFRMSSQLSLVNTAIVCNVTYWEPLP